MIPAIDYTARDFETIRARLITYAKSRIPDWNDFLESNWGVVLIEMISYVGDIHSFYLDRSANEAFIDRAQSRKNMLSLSKLIGYNPPGNRAASTTVQVILTAAHDEDIIISRGRVFTTEDCHNFELQNDIVIRAGSLVGDGVVKDVVSRTTALASSGLPDQIFVLPVAPFVDDESLQVSIDTVLWMQVPDFVDSGQNSKHYIVIPDEQGFGIIQFGDGVSGLIPGPNIKVSYQTGGGIKGNVSSGSINNVVGPILDVLGHQVAIALITNSDPATGGEDPEPIDDTRFKAPRSLRTLQRTVDDDDFVNNAMLVDGVYRATALSSDDTPTIDENTVVTYIVPIGGGPAPQRLLDRVFEVIRSRRPTTITLDLIVASAQYYTIDLTATVALHTGFDASLVKKDIRDQLDTFFNLADVDDNHEFMRNIGETIFFSELVSVLFKVRGVKNVVMTSPSSDIVIPFFRFAVLGELNLTFI